MNALIDSLYCNQLSPMAIFKLVYIGSRSIRCVVLVDLVVFSDKGTVTPLALELASEVAAG